MAYNPTASGSRHWVQDTAGKWHRILNITNVAISGGDREEETTETLDEGSTVSVGPPQPKDISIAANVSPGSRGAGIMNDAFLNQDLVTIGFKTPAKVSFNNNKGSDDFSFGTAETNAGTIAIGTDGIVTPGKKGSGTEPDFSDETRYRTGRAIKVGDTLYIIEKITTGANVAAHRIEVTPVPGSAVSATENFAVIEYGLNWKSTVEVLSAMNYDLTPGSPMTETYTLKQTGNPVKPTIYANASLTPE